MNGLTIACASGYYCGTAVTMNSASSHVTNSNGSAEASISGRWSTGVDCNGYSGTLVEKVHLAMDVAGAIGTDNCKTVRDNVFENTASVSFNEAILEPTTAENNYITGFGNAIWATSSASTIDHNVIYTTSGGAALYAFGNSGLVAVTGNILNGNGGDLVSTSTSTSHFSENYCSDSGSSKCYSCIISGYCAGVPTAPFTFP